MGQVGDDFVQSRVFEAATYIPRKIETKELENSPKDPIQKLDPDLVDKICEQMHDEWSIDKLKGGWVYAAVKNAQHKTHDCLVRYDELTDDQRKFDIIQVFGTLRAMASLGYEIGGHCLHEVWVDIAEQEDYRDKVKAGYTLRRIDFSDVQLTEELRQLVDLLARNNHETWAEEKLDQGWTYGIREDEVRLTHPLLIPYDAIPESDKQRNRNQAEKLLRSMLALGYTITRLPDAPEPSSVFQPKRRAQDSALPASASASLIGRAGDPARGAANGGLGSGMLTPTRNMSHTCLIL